jgi:hypothetical protein
MRQQFKEEPEEQDQHFRERMQRNQTADSTITAQEGASVESDRGVRLSANPSLERAIRKVEQARINGALLLLATMMAFGIPAILYTNQWIGQPVAVLG